MEHAEQRRTASFLSSKTTTKSPVGHQSPPVVVSPPLHHVFRALSTRGVRDSERERSMELGAQGDLNTLSAELKPLRNSPVNSTCRCELFERYELLLRVH